jgi:hypothetical protein
MMVSGGESDEDIDRNSLQIPKTNKLIKSGGGTAVRKRKGRNRGGEILHDTFFCPSSVFSSG